MIYRQGTARIRDKETDQIYEISADAIDFEPVETHERGMGPETTYAAIVDHPELGQLVWSLWEYPVGVENDRDTNVDAHELLENIDFGLQHEPPDDDQH